MPKRPPVLHDAPPPSSLPPDQALSAQPSDFLARLGRLQPERGQLTLLAGALIPSRWAGGLHRGPSCPDKPCFLVTMCDCV